MFLQQIVCLRSLYVDLTHMQIKILNFTLDMQKVTDVGFPLRPAKQVQHMEPTLGSVLYRPLESFCLFGPRLELVVLPGRVFTVTSLHTTDVYTSAFAVTSLAVIGKTYISSVWCL